MSTVQDDLGNLLEIQSLEQKIKSHLDLIEQEQSRLNRVETFRAAKQKRLDELSNEIQSLYEFISVGEKEIHTLESKLKKTRSHLSMVTTQQELDAQEHELKILEPKLDELQDHGLAQLERLEDFETEAQELQTYLEGSLETIQEIQNEIKQVEDKENSEIKKIESRIDLLKENIGPDSLMTFEQLNTKYRFNRPITFLLGESCRECRFQMDRATIADIERYTHMVQCSGCGRILTV